jgi:hypothetical protein
MAAFTFEIKLLHTDPGVTRVVKVSSDSSMYLLHHIIQQVMTWKNYHLYHFTIGERTIGDVRLLEEEAFGEVEDGKSIKVEDVFTHTGMVVEYLYDIGDYWEHEIQLIDISDDPQTEALPILVGGKNGSPPEDCGGVEGFIECKRILSNPLHPEFTEMFEWVGRKSTPLRFNKKAAEKELSKLNAMIKMYEAGFSN